MNQHASNTHEAGLLRDIGGLYDRVRAMRQSSPRDSLQIKALEGQARTKWEEVRRLRAGPVNADASQLTPRGLRR